jgi:Flp pilus assembly protein TadD
MAQSYGSLKEHGVPATSLRSGVVVRLIRLSVHNDSQSGSSHADRLSQSGVDLLAEGEVGSAAQAFREAIDADPGHIEAHHGLIRALSDAGEFEAAVTAARALTALTPNDPLAHTSLSIALQRAGQIPEAEAAASRARILEWKQQLAAGPQDL